MSVVRSPQAHGRIVEVDVAAAWIEGVVAILTGADLAEDLAGAVPKIPPRVSFDERVVPYLQPVLATDVVRYVGEPVAIVLATNRYIAEDAAELVFVELDDIETVTDPREADSAAPLFQGGNAIAALDSGYGDPTAAIADAPVVVTLDLSVGRHTGVPMETRGIVVEYAADDRLIVHGATKVPHWNRTTLAELLQIAPERIALREGATGGGFGVRGELYPEDVVAVWAASRLRRSVRWIEDRREHLVAANHAREQFHTATIAGDENGHISAIATECWVDLGAYVRTHGIRVPDLTLSMIPGPYDIPNYAGVAHCVVTNRTPTATYRAPGRFESSFVRERLIDVYAARCGLDPIDVRRKNLIRPDQLPYPRPLRSTGEPMVFTDGDYGALLDKIESEVDWADVAARRAAGEHVGVGIAVFLEKSGLGPWESGSVTVEPDGRVRVRSGGSSVGQGIRTVLAQIVAERLEVDVANVTVEPLDTDITKTGIGTYASRSTVTAGSAVLMAADTVIDQARELVATSWEIHPADLHYEGGKFTVRGDPSQRIDLAAVATLASEAGGAERLHADEVFNVERVVYPHGAHAAVVAVDPDTGHVTVERLILGYDIGRAINPMLVRGQMVGGAVQALGGTLLEAFKYDDAGNPLAASFMDYLLPTLTDTPEIEIVLLEAHPTPTNPLGAKGAGEGGVTGVAAAIAGAIDQALQRPGAVLDLPATPESVRAAIRSAV